MKSLKRKLQYRHCNCGKSLGIFALIEPNRILHPSFVIVFKNARHARNVCNIESSILEQVRRKLKNASRVYVWLWLLHHMKACPSPFHLATFSGFCQRYNLIGWKENDVLEVRKAVVSRLIRQTRYTRGVFEFDNSRSEVEYQKRCELTRAIRSTLSM